MSRVPSLKDLVIRQLLKFPRSYKHDLCEKSQTLELSFFHEPFSKRKGDVPMEVDGRPAMLWKRVGKEDVLNVFFYPIIAHYT